jgi:hypothetical protein
MNLSVELSRRTWQAAVKLAVIISVVAALIVVAVADSVPQSAIVLPVIVVAFTASWVQTGRVQRNAAVTVRQRAG